MAISEERMRVLQMIETGQITAEEGARLLEALRDQDSVPPGARSQGYQQSPRRFHVRITDIATGQSKVDINLPWSLVSVGMNMGAKFAPGNIDLEQIIGSVDPSAPGKVMDVIDEEEGEHVEIFVE
ncbi:MAG: DUF2089 domain-containing protein [Chloroflexi bacterium]|nr:DUF2089 domain-containing protein [Chloroflexota bacterium]